MPFWGYLLFVTGILRTGVSGFTNNFVEIDLRYGIVKGYSPYITFVQTPTPTRDRTCAAQAVIRMDFSGPYKGAKFLLDYGESPRLWTLDVSDSPTGDGFGGDNGTSSNNAEAQIHNRQLRVYGNSLPGYMEASINGGNLLKVVDNFVKKGAKVSVDISDERIEWVQGRKRDYMESRHLFTLSGQKTEFGPVESNVYVGFNRVVRGKYRSGSGLCRVTISLYQPGRFRVVGREWVIECCRVRRQEILQTDAAILDCVSHTWDVLFQICHKFPVQWEVKPGRWTVSVCQVF